MGNGGVTIKGTKGVIHTCESDYKGVTGKERIKWKWTPPATGKQSQVTVNGRRKMSR